MAYDNFLKFYKDNENVLIFNDDGLRPKKSITRDIFVSVPMFVDWYTANARKSLTIEEIARDILEVNIDTGISTVKDHIVNMEQLGFLYKENRNLYKFTSYFLQYVENCDDLDDVIIKKLKSIYGIEDITMFYNSILSTLREGIINGFIIKFPDSEAKFKKAVPNKNDRIKMMYDIYNLYGFKGNNSSPENDNYTPNINYRIFSTIINLDLIEKVGKHPSYSTLDIYKITRFGQEILNQINWNLGINKEKIHLKQNYKDTANLLEILIQNNPDKEGMLDILNEINEKIFDIDVQNCCPKLDVDSNIDRPIPIGMDKENVSRDPQKASNAKAIANYKCEYDENHTTFIDDYNHMPYIETEYLIPLSFQKYFDYSLDIEANIVALCPLCRARYKKGSLSEKRVFTKKMLNKRHKRLLICGIDVRNIPFNN